ncbi:MAG: TetR/AcrR family transcriptional regulator [Betaproteobacteria bacterium]|jgi:AcrR family transcriptional regulator
MARPRAADYEQQRDRILVLAVDAFARTGYAAASMAGLAQACGISKATLYHYYSGKQALLFEALDRYTNRLIGIAERSAESARAPRQALGDTLKALMAEYRHSRAYHVVLLQELKWLSAEQRERIRAQQRAVVGRLGELIDAVAPGAIAPAERSAATMALLGMINFTFAWLRPEGPVSHARFAELAASLWLDGLTGQLPPSPEIDSHEQTVRIQG